MHEVLSTGSVRVVAVGLVAIAAIASGAAAISAGVDAAPSAPSDDAAADIGTPVGDSGLPPDGPADPDDPRTPGDPEPPRDPIDPQTCIQPLASWYGGVIYFGAFLAVVGWMTRRYSLGASFFGLYALAPPTLVTYVLATDCPTTGGPGLGDDPTPSGPNGPEFTDPVVTFAAVPPEAVLGAVGLVLVGTAAVLIRASGDQTVSEVDQTAAASDEGDLLTARDLALAAGRAADRLEAQDAAVENEVYRAWWDLTSRLSVAEPDTATPGEFADAAVAAGLDERDVAELTRLFEEVRYGERDAGAPPGVDPSTEGSDEAATREERAISVFRSIEATDVGEDPTTDSGSGPTPADSQSSPER